MTGETGDTAEALRLLQDLLPDQERVLGKDHPETLTTRSNIATWTGEAGDAAEALRLSQDLLPDRARVLGKDHPDTLTTRHLSYFETLIKLPEHNLNIDEKKFLGLLAGSASLKKDEKKRIIEAVQRLTQQQVDGLIRHLEEERQMLLLPRPTAAQEWAELEMEMTADERARAESSQADEIRKQLGRAEEPPASPEAPQEKD